MQEDLLSGVRFMGAISVLIFSFVLVLLYRGRKQTPVYNFSRWLLVFGTFILGVQTLVQFFGHYREQDRSLAWVINLMCYIWAVPAFYIAVLNILRAGRGIKLLLLKSVIFIIVCLILFDVGLISDTLFNKEYPYHTMTFGIAFLFFLEILLMNWRVFHELRSPNKNLTLEEKKSCEEALRFFGPSAKVLTVCYLSIPWIGMLGNLMFHAIFGLLNYCLLIWFLSCFYLYGYNMNNKLSDGQ